MSISEIFHHIGKFIFWLLDILFGIAVIVAIIMIVSVIFFPQDNLLLNFGKWLAAIEIFHHIGKFIFWLLLNFGKWLEAIKSF